MNPLRFFARLAAEPLVKSAYRGILGREPDPAGFAAYVGDLKRHGSVPRMLAAIAGSDEAIQRQISNRAGEWGSLLSSLPTAEALDDEARQRLTTRLAKTGNLAAALKSLFPRDAAVLKREAAEAWVRAAYHSLLGREPESTAFETYASLRGSSSFETSLRAIADSDEHFRYCAAKPDRAALFVRWAFQAILGREPEEEALQSHSTLLREEDGLRHLLEVLVSSAEGKRRMLEVHSHDILQSIFAGLLGREPTDSELDTFLTSVCSPQSLASLIESLSDTAEHRHRILRRIRPV